MLLGLWQSAWFPPHPLLSALGHVLQGSVTTLPWIMTHKTSLIRLPDLHIAWLSTKIPNLFMDHAPGNFQYVWYGEKPIFVPWHGSTLFWGVLNLRASVLANHCEPEWIWSVQQIWPSILSAFSPHYSKQNEWNEVWESRGWEGFIISLWVYCESDCK